MRRFLNTIKTPIIKSCASDLNYLSAISLAHANNTYNDDDKSIFESLKAQAAKNKIKQIKIEIDNEWFTSKSIEHAQGGIQNEDKLIIESLNENQKNKSTLYNSQTGC